MSLYFGVFFIICLILIVYLLFVMVWFFLVRLDCDDKILSIEFLVEYLVFLFCLCLVLCYVECGCFGFNL